MDRPDKRTHSITCPDDQKFLANRAASTKERWNRALPPPVTLARTFSAAMIPATKGAELRRSGRGPVDLAVRLQGRRLHCRSDGAACALHCRRAWRGCRSVHVASLRCSCREGAATDLRADAVGASGAKGSGRSTGQSNQCCRGSGAGTKGSSARGCRVRRERPTDHRVPTSIRHQGPAGSRCGAEQPRRPHRTRRQVACVERKEPRRPATGLNCLLDGKKQEVTTERQELR